MSLIGLIRSRGTPGEGDRGDHHRVADQLPLGGLPRQGVLEPVQLRPTGDRSVRIRGRRIDLDGELLVPVGAEVEQAELDEVAVLQPPVDLGAVAEGRGAVEADRHPLVVRLLTGCSTCRPVALGGGVVVDRTALPGVVSGLVVVPGGDDRVLRVQPLQVGVELVLRVPLPVVGQLQRSRGRARACGCRRRPGRSRTRRDRTRRCSRRGAGSRCRSLRLARCR